MKLVETPFQNNLDLNYFYPNITKYIFGTKVIKFFKLYSLDRTQIIYADTYDDQYAIMINTKKKITKQEIDYVVKRILHTTRDQMTIHVGIKKEMLQKGYKFTKPQKDIILLQKKILSH